MLYAYPHPPLRQLRQVGRVGWGGFLVLATTLGLGLPAGATLGEDALQEAVGGFVVAVFGAGKLGLGGD